MGTLTRRDYLWTVAVKSGDGSVLDLTCLKAWKNGLYNYTCPSSPRARLNYVMAYYAVAYSNVYIYKFVFAGATKNITASGPNYITIRYCREHHYNASQVLRCNNGEET